MQDLRTTGDRGGPHRLRLGTRAWASLFLALLLTGCTGGDLGSGGPDTSAPGGTVGAGGPPGISPSLRRYRELAKLELQQGSIVYNPPAQMRLEDTTRIEARVTRHPDPSFTSNLQGKGKPQVEQLPVGTKMRGQLLSDDFAITPLRPEVQLLGEQGSRSWVWDIKPSRTGDLALTLLVSVVFEGDTLDYKSFDRNIKVTVTRSRATGTWMAQNWDKVLGLVGGGAVAGILAFFRRRIRAFVARRTARRQSGAEEAQTPVEARARPESHRNPHQVSGSSRPTTVHRPRQPASSRKRRRR
jgi:hypothetical protein